jgi:hypothetical protein
MSKVDISVPDSEIQDMINLANSWLAEKGLGILTHHEIIQLLPKIKDVTLGSENLAVDVPLCIAEYVCGIRGIEVPLL